MYMEGRYMTITGNHLEGTPTTIEERTAELSALHARIFAEKVPASTNAPAVIPGPPADDHALVSKAMNAENGAKFSALWHGDTSAYGSASEADLALCNLLAFWTAPDHGRIDRLFRQSGLMRDKWDERRGPQTYGDRTIETAINATCDTYTGG
jgi:primase-polymerase (primpol)-like protein